MFFFWFSKSACCKMNECHRKNRWSIFIFIFILSFFWDGSFSGWFVCRRMKVSLNNNFMVYPSNHSNWQCVAMQFIKKIWSMANLAKAYFILCVIPFCLSFGCCCCCVYILSCFLLRAFHRMEYTKILTIRIRSVCAFGKYGLTFAIIWKYMKWKMSVSVWVHA